MAQHPDSEGCFSDDERRRILTILGDYPVIKERVRLMWIIVVYGIVGSAATAVLYAIIHSVLRATN